MEPALVLLLVVLVGVVVAVVAAVVVNRRRRPREDPTAHRAFPPAGQDNVNVRHNRALEREHAAAPTPTDPAVAALAAQVRDRYRVGRHSWDANATGVRRELDGAGRTGLDTAVWVVERMLADFRWELDFWLRESDRSGAPTVRERFAQLPFNAQPNPFHSVSGYHPRIHLVAAAETLTANPRHEVARPLADLLELWFAFGESRDNIGQLDVTVLEALANCYRATPTAAHPEFLTRLAGENVTADVVNLENVVSHVEDGITYVNPLFHDDGSYSLSALARSATSR